MEPADTAGPPCGTRRWVHDGTGGKRRSVSFLVCASIRDVEATRPHGMTHTTASKYVISLWTLASSGSSPGGKQASTSFWRRA